MAILRPDEIREMTPEEKREQLVKLTDELIRERAIASAGGAPDNPGRIREIRRTIARIKTIQREQEEA
ncbi:MAG: 50S ribosomal protein L29 [Methanocellales archaeon]|nr:50S ribosomal protein L29 [Methanocellales archaeon]MDD3291129.1 50S ribosomal protein L29 [Methanocellales archaeon]MDD5484615.1 50S ribosomal protein L29 [Methanocellales archaeon]